MVGERRLFFFCSVLSNLKDEYDPESVEISADVSFLRVCLDRKKVIFPGRRTGVNTNERRNV